MTHWDPGVDVTNTKRVFKKKLLAECMVVFGWCFSQLQPSVLLKAFCYNHFRVRNQVPKISWKYSSEFVIIMTLTLCWQKDTILKHDDAIKWKHFPRYWPFVRGIPPQRPVTRRFDVFFDLRLNKRLSKQSWGWLFETPSRSLWRHCKIFTLW